MPEIPAGGTVILMHFLTVAQDPGTAEARAGSLVNLSDAAALAGMTPAEKAAVVNFVVPR
jgi:hypothetical protein